MAGTRRTRATIADAVPAVVAAALLAVQVDALYVSAAPDVRARSPGLLAFQAVVVGLLAAAAGARRRSWTGSLLALGGLGALMYGMLTWAVWGVLDVVAAALAGWRVVAHAFEGAAGR